MGFFTVQEFNDFWDAMNSLNDKFAFYKGASVTLNGGHITADTMPFPSVMNSYYERNLDKLATLTSPLITLDTRTWKARDVYTRADYDHLLKNLKELQDNLEGEIVHTLYCGTFQAGSDRTVQLLGRGN